jgi:hypothetical protein
VVSNTGATLSMGPVLRSTVRTSARLTRCRGAKRGAVGSPEALSEPLQASDLSGRPDLNRRPLDPQ